MTRAAQDVSVELLREFPRSMSLPLTSGRTLSAIVSAELAFSLLQEPGHHLFNTYRRKGSPSNVKVESPAAVGCVESDCILILVKHAIRTGACPRSGCLAGGSVAVYRGEQKLVDTMLTCDLVYTAMKASGPVILVSGDDDFLPPLRSVLLHGVQAVRLRPKPNCPPADFPTGGVSLIEMDL